MVALQKPSVLADDLSLLASALDFMDLDAADPALDGARKTRDRLIKSIRSYLIPRLTDPGSPLTVVFAGPTGSGKSTIVNSLSGLEVSETGPLRPTTKEPVVLVAETHAGRFSQISEIDCRVVTGRAPILGSLALVDTPDIDSTSVDHRVAAEILIDNADVVVFVTSALRYADRVPWEVLRRAMSRGTPVVHVLNRVSPDSSGAMVDFRARLATEGVETDVVRVPEHHVALDAHSVPAAAVRRLQRRLVGIVREIDQTKKQAFGRVLDSTVDEIIDLADALEIRLRSREMRRERVRVSFAAAARRVDLAGLWDGIAPPEPTGSWLGRLLWKVTNRLPEREWLEVEASVKRRLVALVESDVRRLAVPVSSSESLNRIVEITRTMVVAAIDAWFAQVERLSKDDRFSAFVVAHSATQGRPTAALQALFEDESVVVRAYRGLASRLEIIYSEIGDRVAGTMHAAAIDPVDTERLREVAAAVVVRSHFADA